MHRLRLGRAVLPGTIREQRADLEQIHSWDVTQPSIQLALVFAASFCEEGDLQQSFCWFKLLLSLG